MTVVTTHYRYKRPPRRRKAVGLEVPVIVKRPKAGKTAALRKKTSGRGGTHRRPS